MQDQITIDKAGRVVIPKPMRDALCLRPGDMLQLTRENGHIVLAPLDAAPPMMRKDGVWIRKSGTGVTQLMVDDTLAAIRERRDGEA